MTRLPGCHPVPQRRHPPWLPARRIPLRPARPAGPKACQSPGQARGSGRHYPPAGELARWEVAVVVLRLHVRRACSGLVVDL